MLCQRYLADMNTRDTSDHGVVTRTSSAQETATSYVARISRLYVSTHYFFYLLKSVIILLKGLTANKGT